MLLMMETEKKRPHVEDTWWNDLCSEEPGCVCGSKLWWKNWWIIDFTLMGAFVCVCVSVCTLNCVLVDIHCTVQNINAIFLNIQSEPFFIWKQKYGIMLSRQMIDSFASLTYASLLVFSMLLRKHCCAWRIARDVITSACQPVHRFTADIIPANLINKITPSACNPLNAWQAGGRGVWKY